MKPYLFSEWLEVLVGHQTGEKGIGLCAAQGNADSCKKKNYNERFMQY